MKRYAVCLCLTAMLLTGLSACSSGQASPAASSAENTQSAMADTAAAPADTDSTDAAAGTDAAGTETAASADTALSDTDAQTDAARTEPPERTTAAAQSALPEDQPLFTVKGEAAADSDTMTMQVELARNPGFRLLSLRVYYDEKLTPVSDGEQCEYENGSITGGALATCPVNPDAHLIGYVTIGQDMLTGDGTVFTTSLKLPEGAKSGDSYQFALEVLEFSDGQNDLTAAAEPAEIVVK